MALIPHTQAQIGGVVLAPTAATAGPDTLRPDDRLLLIVQNGSAGTVAATITVPGNTKYGQAQPDITSANIAAGALHAFGPFPADLADPADGLVDVDVNPSASVSLYAVRV
ncbi:hypothetical protein DMH01_03305 [Amycolatopsis sp. WAC 04182]|uniref:hypothetical protein n=1 Tax=Amycolatopsis sp. WAC 04182 TaxID=2203198 RepID=UPI000F7AC2EC|nr:hypothetical protein [Amycolatopsis sp. WAC 04182]RSN65418.1 hypothetical protein DMH01_03305 [Amycolatopsis sp. WAC 04182]